MLFILLTTHLLVAVNADYYSTMMLTSMGLEFQPKLSIQLLATTTRQTRILCSAACNQLPACRTFDYDSLSHQCRLFEGDTTTGSLVPSSSSTSRVGSVVISPALYSSIHNQPCQACQYNRYETCASNSSACQCPSHTYWNGSVCALQLFKNSTCPQQDACRSDLNLICAQECYGQFPRCVSAIADNSTGVSAARFGVTVAGTCNGNSTENATTLVKQAGITIDGNNTIYVGDNSNRLLSFEQNNPTAYMLQNFSTWPTFIFYDNRTSLLYVTFMSSHIVRIWPTNKTIPSNTTRYSNCSFNWLYNPSGIVVDSVGNVYIASYFCSWVTKWAPNATSGTLIAGKASGVGASGNMSLHGPYNLALDEANSFIYVADRLNHRISRFVLGGSGVGVIVAGGNGPGSAANQLNGPTDIYLSNSGTEIYIADSYNSRVQKWLFNTTTGTTVAGSPDGLPGNSSYLMNTVYSITVDSEENYLYASDSNNSRIQRFSLH